MGQRHEFECRRGEDRGAALMRVGGVSREEGVRRAGCGHECPALHWGAVPPPEKNRFCISNRRILVQTECFWKVQANHLSTDHK